MQDENDRRFTRWLAEWTAKLSGNLAVAARSGVDGLADVTALGRDVADAGDPLGAISYRSVFDVLQEGIQICDASGRVLASNPSAERILRQDAEAIRARRLTDWTVVGRNGSPLQTEDLPVAKALATGQTQPDFQLGCVTPEGGIAWLNVRAEPLLQEGRIYGVAVSFLDITERVEVETALKRHQADLEARVKDRTLELHAALEARDKLNAELVLARDAAQSAAGAKSAFLANTSHEIRTPLNAIIGLNHLMQRDPLAAPVATRVAQIGDAAQHLLKLVNNVLDLSKIEAGKIVLEEVEFNLDALLRRAVGIIAQQAADKGLTVHVDADPDPRVLIGDATRVAQALVNLLSNAVKFTERGSVRLRSTVVTDGDDEGLVRFEVRDTGIGLSPHALGQVFAPFEQADTTTTRRYGGTGLGLTITRHIAELMGGEAGAESALGVGSTFWFTVRLKLNRPSNATSASMALAGMHVLLVDDLADVREVTGALLEIMEVRVDLASSGAQALELVDAAEHAGDPFDLVIVDWLMPAMDGIETVRRLRSLRTASPLRCAMMSGLSDSAMQAQALELGVTAFISKPIGFDDLERLLLSFKDERALSQGLSKTLLKMEERFHAAHAGARVLVAEDNPVNQQVARALLEAVGLTVDVVETGRMAVEAVRSNSYHAVLLDRQMPDMDGLQAVQALRADPTFADLPVIAMTASAYDEEKAECIAAGMNDHVSKPVEPERLYAVLDRWLAGRGI